MRVWLGVDLGTTGTRCLAFDAELNVLASAYRANPPDHHPDGRVEQDPASWFETTAEAIAEVASLVGSGSIEAMSISSQGISIVPVDADGGALRPAISWLDLRGEQMLPELARQVDPLELSRVTGKPWSGTYSLPKMLWLARHEPDVLRASRWVLMPLDYLLLRLTGRAATDHTMASGSMAYRLDTQTWDEALISQLGIEASLFPEIVWSGSQVGRLLPQVARRLGLGEIPVMMGGQDQKCAALAAGLGEGVTTLSLGTAAALESLHSGPGESSPVPTFSFLAPEVWVREAPIETAGAAHRWITDLLFEGDYGKLEELVGQARPGGDRPLFFPYLSRVGQGADRQRWGVEPAGVFWGLGLDAQRHDLARAVLEGVSFEIAHHLELMGDDHATLRVFGGGARSQVWGQTLADVTNRRIEMLVSPEAAAAGAAMLAGCPGKLPTAAAYVPGEAAAVLKERLVLWSRIKQNVFS